MASAEEADNLSQQLANPVASLISVPFQQNFEFNGGYRENGFRYVLNIQPVIPISLNADWNLISRTIVPIVHQNGYVPFDDNQAGLGDVLQSFFLSPQQPGPGGVVWGFGPAILAPTATSKYLGSDQLGIGPTAVVLKQIGKLTVGVLANHVWRVAGNDGKPDVDQTFLQPFASYTLGQGWSVNANLESTYDWTAKQWIVPGQLGVAKVTKIFGQPVSLGLNARAWLDRPQGAPNWALRAQVTLLYPRN